MTQILFGQNKVQILFIRESLKKHLHLHGTDLAMLNNVSNLKKCLSINDIINFICFNELILESLKPINILENTNFSGVMTEENTEILNLLTLTREPVKEEIKKELAHAENIMDSALYTIDPINEILFLVSVNDLFYEKIGSAITLRFFKDLLTLVNKFTGNETLFNMSIFKWYLSETASVQT